MRSSPGPASSPASAPADSAKAGRRRQRSGGPKPTRSPSGRGFVTRHDQCSPAAFAAVSHRHEQEFLGGACGGRDPAAKLVRVDAELEGLAPRNEDDRDLLAEL